MTGNTIQKLAGIYFAETGIYRVAEGSDGKLSGEIFRKNEFVPTEHLFGDVFAGLPITENDVKAIASLAEGNTSNLVDQGKGLYRISNSLSLTIESAKEAVR